MSSTTTRRDVIIIVNGEDWDGNAEPRALSSGSVLVLRGKFGEGFDLNGPHASMCRDCGTPVFVESGDRVTRAVQSHYSDVHGYTPALLA